MSFEAIMNATVLRCCSNRRNDPIVCEAGSVLIEIALALPPTLLFIFGLFYFCLVLFGYGGAVFGTRAAARYGALHSASSLNPATTASISSAAQSYVIAAPAGGTQVNVRYSSSGNVIGNTLLVSMSVNYPSFIPFMTGQTVKVGSSAQRTITR